jgi:hypothetical protein
VRRGTDIKIVAHIAHAEVKTLILKIHLVFIAERLNYGVIKLGMPFAFNGTYLAKPARLSEQ